MRIEHAALYVSDLEAARDFFVRHLGARISPESPYHNPNSGFTSYFLTFDDGARLEVMSKPGVRDDRKEPERTGWAHVAFSLGSKEEVNRLTSELKDAGYQVVSGPRTTGDGYYESCILGPEDIRIELTA
jgi:lactoylglutathione lyase